MLDSLRHSLGDYDLDNLVVCSTVKEDSVGDVDLDNVAVCWTVPEDSVGDVDQDNLGFFVGQSKKLCR